MGNTNIIQNNTGLLFRNGSQIPDSKLLKLRRFSEELIGTGLSPDITGSLPQNPPVPSTLRVETAKAEDEVEEKAKTPYNENTDAFFKELDYWHDLFGLREYIKYDELVETIGEGAQKRIAQGDSKGILVIYGVRINRTVACRGIER